MTSLAATGFLSATTAYFCLPANVAIYMVRRQNTGHNGLCFPFECVHSLLSQRAGVHCLGRDGVGGGSADADQRTYISLRPLHTTTRAVSLFVCFIFKCVQYWYNGEFT